MILTFWFTYHCSRGAICLQLKRITSSYSHLLRARPVARHSALHPPVHQLCSPRPSFSWLQIFVPPRLQVGLEVYVCDCVTTAGRRRRRPRRLLRRQAGRARRRCGRRRLARRVRVGPGRRRPRGQGQEAAGGRGPRPGPEEKARRGAPVARTAGMACCSLGRRPPRGFFGNGTRLVSLGCSGPLFS